MLAIGDTPTLPFADKLTEAAVMRKMNYLFSLEQIARPNDQEA
jgi:hypothetical protein